MHITFYFAECRKTSNRELNNCIFLVKFLSALNFQGVIITPPYNGVIFRGVILTPKRSLKNSFSGVKVTPDIEELK